jgi:hypothetical protein
MIKIPHANPRKTILWAGYYSSPCIQRHAQLVRLDGDRASGSVQHFASDFNSRTSDDVHARLTVFFTVVFFADFFLAMSSP